MRDERMKFGYEDYEFWGKEGSEHCIDGLMERITLARWD
jgi:hypothetical protein